MARRAIGELVVFEEMHRDWVTEDNGVLKITVYNGRLDLRQKRGDNRAMMKRARSYDVRANRGMVNQNVVT